MSRRILIIEDNDTLRRAYARFLGRGYEVCEAETGEQAVALLESGEFDVVLSDNDLASKMTGLDVWHWVREHKPHYRGRYIFCTGTDDQRLASVEAPVFPKPAQLVELFDTIHRIAAEGKNDQPGEGE